MRRTSMMFLAAVFIVAPMPCAAQRAELVAQGSKIRVSTARSGQWVGHLDSLNGTTLAMSRSEKNVRAPSFTISRDQVVRLEVRRRSHLHGAFIGGGIGFLAGVVSGALLGVLTYEEDDCFIFCSASESAALGGLVGAFVVTPIGIVGGAMRGADTWKGVDPGSVKMR